MAASAVSRLPGVEISTEAVWEKLQADDEVLVASQKVCNGEVFRKRNTVVIEGG